MERNRGLLNDGVVQVLVLNRPNLSLNSDEPVAGGGAWL